MHSSAKAIGSVAGSFLSVALYFSIFNPAGLGTLVAEHLGTKAFQYMPQHIRSATIKEAMKELELGALQAAQGDPNTQVAIEARDDELIFKYTAGFFEYLKDDAESGLINNSCGESPEMRWLIDLGIKFTYQYWQADRLTLGFGEPKLIKKISVTSCAEQSPRAASIPQL